MVRAAREVNDFSRIPIETRGSRHESRKPGRRRLQVSSRGEITTILEHEPQILQCQLRGNCVIA